MRRQGRARTAGLLVLGAMLTAATPFPRPDLPSDLPERRPGLWEIHTEGHLNSGTIKTYEERTRICLNPKVDRALYQNELDGKYATVSHRDGSCDSPIYAFDGNRLSMSMQCTSKGIEGGPRVQTTFESTTHYAGPDRVDVEHRRVDHGYVALEGSSTYHETMTRVGDCEPGKKPGDRVRVQALFDGDEIQKSMATDNILRAYGQHSKLMEDLLATDRRLNEMGL